MKMIVVFILLFSTLTTQASTSAENFRCWADPGFYGVIKIDVVAKLMCVTGFDGVNYDCDQQAVAVVPLVDVQDSTVDFYGDRIQAKTFHAQSSDKSNDAVLTVYLKDYPRRYFPEFNVSLADLKMNNIFWPYSYKWSAKPIGEITDDQLYCLSEQYFIK